ncbi:Transcriptional regulator, contains XRE-family HTH domain [Desulfofundulus australicus DSM 11792]|uniref:Transcriptional regulator, contains XRE-family HTH domain n=1 Tax=Desulfofundulus australicus DSM 11792 TaxID=1121425 RepID=A0A1M5EAC4_9FIRM|nr:helix-turn-helix transcriptional regulator [Desulfofundulus australicus]SHF76145.1 Transcriptional regulator, contains XRE-family HTH domain [Desulfofundulus australicus DSM 11792]
MGTNQVRYFREKAGLSVKELARKTNLHTAWVLQVERAENSWGRTPWGYDTDKKFADALGVKLADLFSDYRPPERPKEEPQPVRQRSNEEIAEELRLLNERRQQKIVGEREIYDAMDEVEQWCPGVVCGPGARKHDFSKAKGDNK